MTEQSNQAISWARKALAQDRAGLFSDIDGTISPIAPTPAEAMVDPRCREALRQLSRELTLVAIVSGRSASDALAMVGLPDIVYVGNHGLETWEDGQLAVNKEVDEFRPVLDVVLDRLNASIHVSGVLIEDKGSTASIHYRNAADPEGARKSVLDAIALIQSSGSIRVSEGRMVVEIRPPVESDKGTAVAELVRQHRLEGAAYLGDDTTDLDAFRAIQELQRRDVLKTQASIAVKGPEIPDVVLLDANATVDGIDGTAELLESLARELGQG